MKRREDFEIVMRCIGGKIDDKQIIDIMTLNSSQSQIDGEVVDRLVRSMKKLNLTAKDAFNLTEPRLKELKSIIHEKLLMAFSKSSRVRAVIFPRIHILS